MISTLYRIAKGLFTRGDEIIALEMELDMLERKPAILEQDYSPILEKVGTFLRHHQDKNHELASLARKFIGLQYRIEILDTQPFSKSSFDWLRDLAAEWKKNHPLVGIALLSAKDLSHLKKAAEYSEFISLLETDARLCASFMDWVLRDENDAAPFIEFPATADQLTVSNLSSRLSRHGETLLRILKNGFEKFLALPFEGRFQSILDPQARITFRGQYILTIEEIFAVFAKKDVAVGNLEVMKEGIINWNIHMLGYFDAVLNGYVKVDLEKSHWWEDMPVFETLNRRQVAQRYGVHLQKGDWIAAETATRGRLDLDYEETHAFLEVAIPSRDGRYLIYDFGKLSLEYPDGFFDRMKMLTKTVHATVAYPDDNVFYTHRQKGFHPFVLKNFQGFSLMSLIKEDILTARARNFIYQIQSENCAKWVHEKLEKVLGKEQVPDFFRMQLLDTEPKGPIALLFRLIKRLPEPWQVPVFTRLHLPLGASRKIWILEEGKRVAKSLATHSFFETGQVYLPALLIAKVFAQASSLRTRFELKYLNWQNTSQWLLRGVEFLYATMRYQVYSRLFRSPLLGAIRRAKSRFRQRSEVFGALQRA